MKINKCTQCVYAVNNDHCGLRGFTSHFNLNYCSAQNVDKLPNSFELQEDGYFSWVNKNPKYPKTYDECCAMLGYSGNYNMILTTDVDNKLFDALYRLKVCRDAYWKIAGEQMGLGKSWEPDWDKSDSGYVYCIVNKCNNIGVTCEWLKNNYILSFPTAEMRDAFYKNFKDLIERCKKLL